MFKIVVYNRKCPECGEEFEAKRKDKIYCSVNCRVNAHRRSKEILMICDRCGKPFYRKRGAKIKLFCSPECRDKQYKSKVRHAVDVYKKKNADVLKITNNSLGTTNRGTEKNKINKKAITDVDQWKEEIKDIKKLMRETFNE